MSSIRKELNELAIKMGAPIVGSNISEQIRALNTHLGGTSHGANISERIDEFSKVFNESSLNSNFSDIKTFSWEQGSLEDYTAEEKDAPDKIRTTDYIDFDGEKDTDCTLLAWTTDKVDLMSCFVCFDKNKNDIKDIYWISFGERVSVPENTKFLKFILKRPGGQIISPDDLSGGYFIKL